MAENDKRWKNLWPRSSKSLKFQQQWTAFGVKRGTLIPKFNRERWNYIPWKRFKGNEGKKNPYWIENCEWGGENGGRRETLRGRNQIGMKERERDSGCNFSQEKKMVKYSQMWICKAKEGYNSITILNFVLYHFFVWSNFYFCFYVYIFFLKNQNY